MLLMRKNEKKNGAIWCILSVPKYAIINLNINNFQDYKSATTNSIRHISPLSNLNVRVNKQLHFIRGSGGQRFKKKKNQIKWRLFL